MGTSRTFKGGDTKGTLQEILAAELKKIDIAASKVSDKANIEITADLNDNASSGVKNLTDNLDAATDSAEKLSKAMKDVGNKSAGKSMEQTGKKIETSAKKTATNVTQIYKSILDTVGKEYSSSDLDLLSSAESSDKVDKSVQDLALSQLNSRYKSIKKTKERYLSYMSDKQDEISSYDGKGKASKLLYSNLFDQDEVDKSLEAYGKAYKKANKTTQKLIEDREKLYSAFQTKSKNVDFQQTDFLDAGENQRNISEASDLLKIAKQIDYIDSRLGKKNPYHTIDTSAYESMYNSLIEQMTSQNSISAIFNSQIEECERIFASFAEYLTTIPNALNKSAEAMDPAAAITNIEKASTSAKGKVSELSAELKNVSRYVNENTKLEGSAKNGWYKLNKTDEKLRGKGLSEEGQWSFVGQIANIERNGGKLDKETNAYQYYLKLLQENDELKKFNDEIMAAQVSGSTNDSTSSVNVNAEKIDEELKKRKELNEELQRSRELGVDVSNFKYTDSTDPKDVESQTEALRKFNDEKARSNELGLDVSDTANITGGNVQDIDAQTEALKKLNDEKERSKEPGAGNKKASSDNMMSNSTASTNHIFSPSQTFDNEVQKNLVYLENYKNTIKEIDNLKLAPQTDETVAKMEELNKLADYYVSQIDILRSESGGYVSVAGLRNSYGLYGAGLMEHYTYNQLEDLRNIGKEKEGLQISSVTSEFKLIGEEISRIESKSEGLKNTLSKDLIESKAYVSKLKAAFLDLAETQGELKTESSPKWIEAYNGDIGEWLTRFPELLQFKDKFLSYDSAREFVKTDEWNDFLATLPQAHSYLESIGYEFKNIGALPSSTPAHQKVTDEIQQEIQAEQESSSAVQAAENQKQEALENTRKQAALTREEMEKSSKQSYGESNSSYKDLLALKYEIKTVDKSYYSGKANYDWVGFYQSQEEAIAQDLADKKNQLHSSLNLILSEDKNALIELEAEANKLKSSLQPVQDMVNRISSNSSIAYLDKNKGSEDWYKGHAEAYKAIDDRLGELNKKYSLSNEELEEYITLAVKAEKIMDRMISNSGGLKGSGARNKAELQSWIEKGFARDLGLNPDNVYNGLFSNITDALYDGKGISLFNSEGKKQSLREVSAEILKYQSATSAFDGAIGADTDAEKLREINTVLNYIKSNINEIFATDFSAQIKKASELIEYFSQKLSEGKDTDHYSQVLEEEQERLQGLIELQERLNSTRDKETGAQNSKSQEIIQAGNGQSSSSVVQTKSDLEKRLELLYEIQRETEDFALSTRQLNLYNNKELGDQYYEDLTASQQNIVDNYEASEQYFDEFREKYQSFIITLKDGKQIMVDSMEGLAYLKNDNFKNIESISYSFTDAHLAAVKLEEDLNALEMKFEALDMLKASVDNLLTGYDLEMPGTKNDYLNTLINDYGIAKDKAQLLADAMFRIQDLFNEYGDGAFQNQEFLKKFDEIREYALSVFKNIGIDLAKELESSMNGLLSTGNLESDYGKDIKRVIGDFNNTLGKDFNKFNTIGTSSPAVQVEETTKEVQELTQAEIECAQRAEELTKKFGEVFGITNKKALEEIKNETFSYLQGSTQNPFQEDEDGFIISSNFDFDDELDLFMDSGTTINNLLNTISKHIKISRDEVDAYGASWKQIREYVSGSKIYMSDKDRVDLGDDYASAISTIGRGNIVTDKMIAEHEGDPGFNKGTDIIAFLSEMNGQLGTTFDLTMTTQDAFRLLWEVLREKPAVDISGLPEIIRADVNKILDGTYGQENNQKATNRKYNIASTSPIIKKASLKSSTPEYYEATSEVSSTEIIVNEEKKQQAYTETAQKAEESAQRVIASEEKITKALQATVDDHQKIDPTKMLGPVKANELEQERKQNGTYLPSILGLKNDSDIGFSAEEIIAKFGSIENAAKELHNALGQGLNIHDFIASYQSDIDSVEQATKRSKEAQATENIHNFKDTDTQLNPYTQEQQAAETTALAVVEAAKAKETADTEATNTIVQNSQRRQQAYEDDIEIVYGEVEDAVPKDPNRRVAIKTTDSSTKQSTTYQEGRGKTTEEGLKYNKKTDEWEPFYNTLTNMVQVENEAVKWTNKLTLAQADLESEMRKTEPAQNVLDAINDQITIYQEILDKVNRRAEELASENNSPFSYDDYTERVKERTDPYKAEVNTKTEKQIRAENEQAIREQERLEALQTKYTKKLSTINGGFKHLAEYKGVQSAISGLIDPNDVSQVEAAFNRLEKVINDFKQNVKSSASLDPIFSAMKTKENIDSIVENYKTKFSDLGMSAEQAEGKIAELFRIAESIKTINLKSDAGMITLGEEINKFNVERNKLDIELNTNRSKNRIDNRVEKAYKKLADTEERYLTLTAKEKVGTATEKQLNELQQLNAEREKAYNTTKQRAAATEEETAAQQRYNEVLSQSDDILEQYISKEQQIKALIDSSSAMMDRFANNPNNLDGFDGIYNYYNQKVADANEKLMSAKNPTTANFDKYKKEITTIQKDLNSIVVGNVDMNDAERAMRQYFASIGVGTDEIGKFKDEQKTLTATFKDSNGSIRNVTLGWKEYTNSIQIVSNTTEQAKSVFGQFFSGLKGRITALAQYLLSFASFYRIISIIKQGFSAIRELDTALTEMRKVSDESTASLKRFQSASFDIASAVGTTGQQIQNSTADWIGKPLSRYMVTYN